MSLFHSSICDCRVEGGVGDAVEGMSDCRCPWIACTRAETSGRLLEKPDGPAVEKKRLGGALGAF